MSVAKRLAKSVPFAHLLGIRAEDESDDDREKREEDEARRAEWEKKAEDDPDRERREDESDEEYAKRMEKMDEEEEEARRAEDRRARGEGEDGDSEEARAERARCAQIIAFGITSNCIRQAAVFAFDTTMSAKVAIANMKATRADGKQSIHSRMSGVAPINPVGADGGEQLDASSSKSVAAAIIQAAKKARGEA